MTGLSIEATLELWASSLRAVKARIRPLFTQERVAASAGLFLDGLLGDERRKTGWMRAEAAGDPGPWRQQANLGRGRWNADDLRDVVRDYVLETLADNDAVLVIDGEPAKRMIQVNHSPGERLPEAGQDVLRRWPAIYELCRQDHQLPDRCVCRLCFAQRSCLHRSGALSAESLDERSCPHGGGACSL